jgi:hypothetical protein
VATVENSRLWSKLITIGRNGRKSIYHNKGRK